VLHRRVRLAFAADNFSLADALEREIRENRDGSAGKETARKKRGNGAKGQVS
jgi:hypothetical protein